MPKNSFSKVFRGGAGHEYLMQKLKRAKEKALNQ